MKTADTAWKMMYAKECPQRNDGTDNGEINHNEGMGSLNHPGARVFNLFIDILLKDGEGAVEHAGKLLNLFVERVLVGPSLPGVQDVARNVVDLGGDVKTEDAESVVVVIGESSERAVVDGVDDGASVLQRATRTRAVLATNPTGIDEPAVGIACTHPLGKHGRVP